MAKLRKKNVQFRLQWESDYLFTMNDNARPQCLICGKIMWAFRSYNLSRHYNLFHKSNIEKLSEDARAELIKDLKSKMCTKLPAIDNSRNNPSTLQKQALAASYAVSLIIGRDKKCYHDGNLIKKGAIEMAKSFNLNHAAECFQSVSLSPQTVAQRIANIDMQIKEKLKSLLASCTYFSLCVDESTDNSDVSQLSIFVRIIQNDFSIDEELLALVPLLGSTKGVDIFNAVQQQVSTFIGNFDKCSAIVTDGAPAMVGNKTGFKGLLRENGIHCPMFHCIIHQETLCGKILKLSETMKTVTKITNMIRGGNKAHSHREFKSFLEEINASYSDLPLHCEIRWLSAGKSLQRFFALRKEIVTFLHSKVKNSLDMEEKCKDPIFLCQLAFLTDITEHLNTLNLKLQKREQTISELLSHVNGFRNRLALFITELSKNEFFNFRSCEEIKKELDDLGLHPDFSIFLETLRCIQHEFEVRFKDFDVLLEDLAIFNNPMKVKIAEQKAHYRLELCDLQADQFLINRSETALDFFKLLSDEKYPQLKNLGLRISSMFGSTYDCESAFSLMKHIKSSKRTSMTNSSLSRLMRIATTHIEIDIPALVEKANRPQCSH